jgi:hypothetical protein
VSVRLSTRGQVTLAAREASRLDERREITALAGFICFERSLHSFVVTAPFARFVKSVRSADLIRDA